MAEWLKALVLKVLDAFTNPANTGLPLMFDISVFAFGRAVLMAGMQKKAAIRFAENRMAGFYRRDNSDGKGL